MNGGDVLTICGIERLTVDRFSSTTQVSSDSQSKLEFVSRNELGTGHHRQSVGGTVGNAMMALAEFTRTRFDPEPDVVWAGFLDRSPESYRAAAELRSHGVVVRPIGHVSGPTLVDCEMDASGDPISLKIAISPDQPVVSATDFDCDAVVVGLDTVADADAHLYELLDGKQKFLLVNHAPTRLSESGLALLKSAGWIGFSGRREEVEQFEALIGTRLGGEKSVGCLTDGARGSDVRRGNETVVSKPSAPISEGIGESLGAGDAFGIGLLFGALVDSELTDAIKTAENVRDHWSLRAVRDRETELSKDLAFAGAKQYFPSVSMQARAIELELRNGPPLAICTGGQTGVDSIAIETAAALGIACHAVFPAGLKREAADEINFGQMNCRIHELSSPSYGDRTAAVVEIGDEFLAFGSDKTEGSKAARHFGKKFGRPVVRAVARLATRSQQTWGEWPLIFSIGGPRGSSLDDAEVIRIRREIEVCLKTLAAPSNPEQFESDTLPDAVLLSTNMQMAIAGIDLTHSWCPNHAKVRDLLHERARTTCECSGCSLNFFQLRGRDVAKALASTPNSIAAVGTDDLEEGEAEMSSLRMVRTKLFSSSLVHLAPSAADSAEPRVLTQYPIAAAETFGAGEVMEILGAAESHFELHDRAAHVVDTFHTGASAATAGLAVRQHLSTTQLALASYSNVGLPNGWADAWIQYCAYAATTERSR